MCVCVSRYSWGSVQDFVRPASAHAGGIALAANDRWLATAESVVLPFALSVLRDAEACGSSLMRSDVALTADIISHLLSTPLIANATAGPVHVATATATSAAAAADGCDGPGATPRLRGATDALALALHAVMLLEGFCLVTAGEAGVDSYLSHLTRPPRHSHSYHAFSSSSTQEATDSPPSFEAPIFRVAWPWDRGTCAHGARCQSDGSAAATAQTATRAAMETGGLTATPLTATRSPRGPSPSEAVSAAACSALPFDWNRADVFSFIYRLRSGTLARVHASLFGSPDDAYLLPQRCALRRGSRSNGAVPR